MDLDKIVEKALGKQDYAEDIKDFTDEQKAQLSLKIAEVAKKKADEELAVIEARRAELKRLNEKPIKQPEDDASVVKKFQDEQEQEAIRSFEQNPDYKVPDELKATFEETYKTLKKGEVSQAQITQVLKRAYAATMGDSLLEARKRVEVLEKGAADFNAQGAHTTVVVSEADKSKYSREAQDLFAEWQKAGYSGKKYTLEQAQKIVSGGMERRI